MATWHPINNAPLQYAKNAGGAAASDYYMKFYEKGTTTPTNMATDSTGGTQLAKCQLNSLGYPVNGSNDVFIPHIDQNYKVALFPTEADADANNFANAIWNPEANIPVGSTITNVKDDYGAVGDGSTVNTTAYQNAIDALPATGGDILTPNDGVYVVGKLTVPSNKPVRFIGGSLKLADATNDSMFEGTNPQDVTFVSMKIDGNSANQSAPVTGGDYPAINLTGAGTNVNIRLCYVTNCIDAGIVVNDVDGVTVLGNFVDAVGWHGIQTAGDCTNVVIASNRVRNIDDAAGIIPMGNAQYVTVANNVIEDISGTGGDGITCYSNTNKYISITGNVIRNINGHGIHCGGEYISVTGNVINSATASGIYVRNQSGTGRHVSVTGNTINAETSSGTFAIDGIYINNINNFACTGNSVNDAQDIGIHLKQCAIGVVSGNTIQVAAGHGVWSEIDGQRISYADNVIKDCGEYGMLFDDEVQGRVSDNLIENFATSDASAYGIGFVDGNIMQVKDNFVRVGSGTLAPVTNGFDKGTLTNSMVRGHFFTDGTNMRGGTATAATSIDIPYEYDSIGISGTTQIETLSVDTAYPGRIINLRFGSTVTVKDGAGNLALNGDLNATNGTMLTLVWSPGVPTVWTEISRSIN
jgi:hypothetical protein